MPLEIVKNYKRIKDGIPLIMDGKSESKYLPPIYGSARPQPSRRAVIVKSGSGMGWKGFWK